MSVPYKYLLQSAMRGGFRLPKLPKRVEQADNHWHGRILPKRYQAVPVVEGPSSPFRPFEIVAQKTSPAIVVASMLTNYRSGNLDNEEYRFWFGAENASSSFAKCRACGKIAYTKRARLEHQSKAKHTVLLVLAYKQLLKDNVCVCCQKRTSRKAWGVYLCSQECDIRWKFVPYNADVVFAVQKVRAENPDRAARSFE